MVIHPPATQHLAYRRLVPLICLLFIVFPATSVYAQEPETDGGTRPKIGLVLSGGGARGAAHIGVLKVLEERRIPIDFIAGTSMGSLVGGLYASGMTPDEIETIVSQMDWVDAFNDKIDRRDRSFRRKRDDDFYLIKNKPGFSGGKIRFPPGLIDGQKIDLLLKRFTLPVVTIRDFDDLSIPYRAVAADITTGDAVVMDRGDLALAMRASMAIPVAFAPREINGRLLVDGGISRNLPVDVARAMGADVVIAVDISTPLQKREQINSLMAITEQLTGIITRRDSDRQIASLHDTDIFINPDLGDITTASFDRAAEAIPIGATAANAVLDKLKRLSVSEPDYEKFRARRRRAPAGLVIDEIRINNLSRLADDVIASRINLKTSRPLDVDHLERDLGQIYGLELFESVYYDVTREAERTILAVTAKETDWGPNYLQFGMAIFEDFEGPNFKIGTAYFRTAVNRWNGEWRSGLQIGQEPGAFTEFHQPIGSRLRNFVHLQALLDEKVLSIFGTDRNKISELCFKRYGASVDCGRELGTWGELRAGLIREAGEIEVQVGDPRVPDGNFDTGEAFVQFFVDELDDVNFPRAGGSLRVRVTGGSKDLGSDHDYEQGTVEGTVVLTRGSYTGVLGGMLASTRDNDAPVQSLFRVGGHARLSGLEQNELSGQHLGLLTATLYKQILGSSLVSLFAGASFEYGNVFQERETIKFDDGISAGSVFLGLDTLLGPIHLAYGRADGGRWNYYLSLGQPLHLNRAAFWKR
jgi:NTE family protein